MPAEYEVCTDCGCGLSNDDWTWLDARPEPPSTVVKISTWVARVGWLPVQDYAYGPFTCECCGREVDDEASGYRFEGG